MLSAWDNDDDDEDDIDFAIVQQRRNYYSLDTAKRRFVFTRPRDETPLRVAIRGNNVEIVAIMLRHLGKQKITAAERDEVLNRKLAPLFHIAVANVGVGFGFLNSDPRTTVLLQLLKDFGADPDLPNPGNKRTLLNIACSLRSAPVPDFDLSRTIQRICKPTQLKVRLEEVEYNAVIRAEEVIEGVLRDYEAAWEAATDPANPNAAPIPLALEKKRFMIGDADLRFAAVAAETNFGGGGGSFGGGGFGGGVRLRYSLSNDTYPQLRDFYTAFICTNCDRDLILARGARRFCAGCFYILCSECMNAEKSTRTVIDVVDGKEKKVLLCHKCDQVVFGEIQ